VTNDLDGTARPLDGDGDGLAEYDLGCCEYDPDTADSNRDGVPDWWYRAHDLDPVSATVAQENADDDPVPNGNEWVALTDPRDGASWFRVERVARTGAVVAVGFSGAVQRVYSLWAREDLTAGDWTGVAGQTNVPGEAGGTTTLQDAADERLRLYRVEVAVP